MVEIKEPRQADLIACNIEMFSTTTTIFVYQNRRIRNFSIPSENAANILAELCHMENIYDLEVSGNKAYLESFCETIKEAEERLYANSKERINIILK